MPSVNDLRTSKYLKKEDVEPPILATINGYDQVDIETNNGGSEKKWVLNFKGLKPMVLNSTNGQLIAKILGSEDFDDWIGKQVVLYNDPSVGFAGKITGGIRVRAAKKAKPAQVPTQIEEIDDEEIPF